MRAGGGTTPGEVADALDLVVALGPGRLDDDSIADARDLRARIDERLGRGDGLTVVAIGGGTGVGKSALLNAVIGRRVAREGVRRPTTAVALAAAPEQDAPTTALLDWLEVPERHTVGDALPGGLVLLDLPDHDSVVTSHRDTAARLSARVDAVVWVVDPVKYARADAHGGPLAAMTAHAEVLLLVLNRTDELAGPAEVEAIAADLQGRLRAGGHRGDRVLATSAATGAGVPELREELARLAATRTAAAARLTGDGAVLGRRLVAEVEELPQLDLDVDALLPVLVEALDGRRVAAEAAHLARRDALHRARSPLARAVAAPVRGAVRAFRGGPPVPAPTTPSRAAATPHVEAVVARTVGVEAAVGRTHGALDRAVRDASASAVPDLLDAVAGASASPPPRRWPVVVAGLRGVAEVVLLAGAGWLTALAVVAWLQLPPLPTPRAVGEVPWPTALFVGGVLVRVALGALTRVLARAGAARHAIRVRRRIERGVRAVATERLLAPIQAEAADQDRLRAAARALAQAEGRAAVRAGRPPG